MEVAAAKDKVDRGRLEVRPDVARTGTSRQGFPRMGRVRRWSVADPLCNLGLDSQRLPGSIN